MGREEALWVFVGGTGGDVAQAIYLRGLDLKGLFIDTENRFEVSDGTHGKDLDIGVGLDRVTGLIPHRIHIDRTGEEVVPAGWRDILLSVDEQNRSLKQGFFANPKVGSLGMSMDGAREIAAIREKLIPLYNGCDDKSIVHIVGSLYGGTGTTVMPHVVTALDGIVQGNCVIEAYVFLPWFVTSNDADNRVREQNVVPSLRLLERNLTAFTKREGTRRGACLVQVKRERQATLNGTPADERRGHMDPWIRAVGYRLVKQPLRSATNPNAQGFYNLRLPSERKGDGGMADHASALRGLDACNIKNGVGWFGQLLGSRSQLPVFLAGILRLYDKCPSIDGLPKKPDIREFVDAYQKELDSQIRRLVGANTDQVLFNDYDDKSMFAALETKPTDAFGRRFQAAVATGNLERAASMVVGEATSLLFEGKKRHFKADDAAQDMYSKATTIEPDNYAYMSTSMSWPIGIAETLAAAASTPQNATAYCDTLCTLWLAAIAGLIEFVPDADMHNRLVHLDRNVSLNPEYEPPELVVFKFVTDEKEVISGAVGFTAKPIGLVPPAPIIDSKVLSYWGLAVGDYKFEPSEDLKTLWQKMREALLAAGMLERTDPQDPKVLNPSKRGVFALRRLIAALRSAPVGSVPSATRLAVLLEKDLGKAEDGAGVAEIKGRPLFDYAMGGHTDVTTVCMPLFVSDAWASVLNQAVAGTIPGVTVVQGELRSGSTTLGKFGTCKSLLGGVQSDNCLISIDRFGLNEAIKSNPSLQVDPKAAPYCRMRNILWLAFLSGLLDFQGGAAPQNLMFAYREKSGTTQRGVVGATDVELGLIPPSEVIDRAVRQAQGTDAKGPAGAVVAVWDEMEAALKGIGMLQGDGGAAGPSQRGTYVLRRLIQILNGAPDSVPSAKELSALLATGLGTAGTGDGVTEYPGCPLFMKDGSVVSVPLFLVPAWALVLKVAKSSQNAELRDDGGVLTYKTYPLARVGAMRPLLGGDSLACRLIGVNYLGMVDALNYDKKLAGALKTKPGKERWL